MTLDWASEFALYSENLVMRIATDGIKYIATFCGALVVSLMLTPVFREVAWKVGMVDRPDARRINKVPIPRGAGLSIFVAFHLVLAALVVVMGTSVNHQFSCFLQSRFLLASSVLAVLGLIDDKRGLRPVTKLAGQVVVALILYGSGVHVGGIIVAFPSWLDGVVTVLWIVGAVNAFNLIDGMDGVAAGLALIASVGLAGALLFAGNSTATLPYLALAGACLGFLRYNFHPASVFLGDTGSMFLGLCLAALPLMTGTRKELVVSLGMPLLVMGVPIFDTMLAVWRRSVRALLPQDVKDIAHRRGWVMQPDKDHLHHRLLRKTMNQRMAAFVLYGMGAALVLVGLGGVLLEERAPGLFLIAFVAAIFVVVRHMECVELWDTGRLLSRKEGALRQGLLVPVCVFLDIVSLCLVWMITRWGAGLPLSRMNLMTDMPRFVVPVFVSLVAAKTYSRVWARAQIRDYAVLCGSVVTGTAVSAGVVWLFGEVTLCVVRFSLLFGVLAIFSISGIRLWRENVSVVMQILERRRLLEKSETLRVLAYGGGWEFRGFLREQGERAGANNRIILGIIDDDINLRGRVIGGYPVIGGLDRVAAWMKGRRVTGVVVTCRMDRDRLERVTHELAGLGLQVSVWVCEERFLTEQGGRIGVSEEKGAAQS